MLISPKGLEIKKEVEERFIIYQERFNAISSYF